MIGDWVFHVCEYFCLRSGNNWVFDALVTRLVETGKNDYIKLNILSLLFNEEKSHEHF